MAKKIRITLSKASIDNAIQEIKLYQNSLNRKCQIFIDKLAGLGIEVVRENMQSVDLGDDDWNYTTELINNSDGKAVAVKILVSGKRLLLIEFGSGIIYSNPQNPKANELGYGVGTYPDGKGNAWSMNGWWYTGEDGESHHSKGNRAYMPVYKASAEMRKQIQDIALQVFGGS